MIKNETLRQRLVELHSIYMTPAPDAYLSRRVAEPEIVFLPGVDPTISTEVHTTIYGNRGRQFAKQSTLTADPERIATAVEAVGINIVGLMIVLGAEQAGEAPSGEAVWRVMGMHAGEKETSIPMISAIYVVRASDEMYVTAPSVQRVLNSLKRYEDAYHPRWRDDIFDPFRLTTTSDVIVTDVTVIRRRQPVEKPHEKPPLIDCYLIRGHQNIRVDMKASLGMDPCFIESRAIRPFTRIVFVAPDETMASVNPFTGKPDPDFYLKQKERFLSKKSEAERVARAQELYLARVARDAKEVEDDDAITGAFM